MITPPVVRAVTSSSAGTVPSTTASEWYRVAVNGIGQAGEHAGAGMLDQRRPAVQQLLGPVDDRAVDLGDRLVAEAHPEDRQPAGGPADHFLGDAGIGRRPGTGREQHPVDARDRRPRRW